MIYVYVPPSGFSAVGVFGTEASFPERDFVVVTGTGGIVRVLDAFSAFVRALTFFTFSGGSARF